MPCEEIRTISLQLEAADRDLLRKAITSLGYQVALDANGRLTFWTPNGVGGVYRDRITVPEGDVGLVNRIKAAYSREVIQHASATFGWRLHQTSAQQLTLTRRY